MKTISTLGGRPDSWGSGRYAHPSGDPTTVEELKAVPTVAGLDRPLNTPSANHIHRARFGTIKPKEPDNAA
jgi:hypothetical protein